MKKNSYLTIRKNSEGIFKDRGSRFLAFAFPADDEEAIRNHLRELRKKYPDARHHCYAWKLGPDGEKFRSNDDQEPSGTAGKPILGQITAHDLTNVLIVVVRYFGGTLLGTGGLINAYRSAAADALGNAEIIEEQVKVMFELRFGYGAVNEVMRTLKESDAVILLQEMELSCRIRCRIPLAETGRVIDKWKRISNLEFTEQN